MSITHKTAGHRNQLGSLLLVLSVLLAPLLQTQLTSAAQFQQTFVRFDRMQISTPTTGTVCVTPATTSAAVKSWQVVFPTGYTVSTTVANWQTANVSTTNLAWPTGGTAWPSVATAVATVSGQTVTWTNGTATTMTAGVVYCYNWTSTAAISTSASATNSNAGSVTTQTAVPATIDTGSYSTATITNDQIVVTATVPTAFSFALSGNTDALGTLATGSVSVSPTPRTATVNTNAANGWMVWAKDANTGLSSAAAGHTIASTTPGTNSTLSAGTEGYNTGITQSQTGGSGVLTVATPFVGGSTGKGGGLDTTLRTLVTSTGTANNAVVTLTNNAAISTLTQAAADYTDTITVVGAGLF